MKNIAATFACLALLACNALQSSEFEIMNSAKSELRDVQISFGDVIVRQKSLAPGENFSFHPSPDHEGGISLSYVQKGKRIEHNLGYAAPPKLMDSQSCKFVVLDNDLRGDCTQN